jgi:uncharacterized repeat protein (TIGR01451 family)
VQLADLGVEKTVGDPTPNEGDWVVYTLVLTNEGPDSATNIEVTDNLPAGVTYVTSSDTNSYDQGGGTWSVPSLAANSSTTLTITVAIDADTGGQTIDNTASVTQADQSDDVSDNDQDNAALTVPLADLGIEKTVGDPTPNEGDWVVYTLVLTNEGPDSATNIEVTDNLPAGVTYVTSSDTNSYDQGGGTWSVPSLAVNSSTTLTITVAIDADTGGQTIDNIARITAADQSDDVPDNDQDNAALTVQLAELGVEKTVGDPTPNEGDWVVYTLVLTNEGPDSATNIEITDNLPGGVTYVTSSDTNSYDQGGAVWSVPSLPANVSTTLTITVAIDAGTGGTSITNAAAVTQSSQADHNGGNNISGAVLTVQLADLGVSKTVTDGATVSGEDLVYTIVVTNAGPDAARNVRVIDTLPDGVATGEPLTMDLGDLAAHAVTSYTFTVTIDGDTLGVITNRATVMSETADDNGGNDSDTAVSVVVRPRHSCTGFRSPGTNEVSCEFHYDSGTVLTSLQWSVHLPAGWGVSGASGDGNPTVDGTNIVFGAIPLTNPLLFTWRYTTPSGAPPGGDMRSTTSYRFDSDLGGSCPVMPNPLSIDRLHHITATAVGQGQISPSGVVVVAYSGSAGFAIEADTYYHVSDVVVDAGSVGIVSNYTLAPVHGDHTIEAFFSADLSPRGTPLWWLAAHGMSGGDPGLEEMMDHDGDGMPTWKEWVADTVPTNAESVLAVTGVFITPAGARVTWRGGTAAGQILERATSVVKLPPEWTAIHTSTPPTPVEASYEDTEAGGLPPPLYYRIRVDR